MTIEDLDKIPASGAANFIRFAAGVSPDIPADAYAAWGDHAVPVDQARRRLSRQTPDIGVFSFADTTANRFGFATNGDRSFISAAQFGPGFGVRHGGFDQPSAGTEVKFDCAAPLYRQGDHIYGHWLLDILPRAWLINTLCPDRKVTYLIRKGGPVYGRAMLEAIGLPPERIVEIDITTTHPHAAQMLVATNMRYNQVVHPAIRQFSDAMIDRLCAETTDAPSEALFISRRTWKARLANKRQLLNAPEVEGFYGTQGYRALAPESLPFAKQVRLFHTAAAMAGSEGSGLHNSLFAAPGIAVDALTSPNNTSLIQASLCIACGQRINMICGQAAVPDTDTPSREVDFAVPVTTLNTRFNSEKSST